MTVAELISCLRQCKSPKTANVYWHDESFSIDRVSQFGVVPDVILSTEISKGLPDGEGK